jgi:catechol 2,3-dioxygenase-like lactoylglutathione lyase family enzyme
MDHLAVPVRDQARSRRFYETYCGFGARAAKRYDDGVLLVYNAAGFSLALAPCEEPIARPSWMHFGIHLHSREAVLAHRDRLVRAGIELVEETDEGVRQRQVPRSGRVHSRGFVGGAAVIRRVVRHRLSGVRLTAIARHTVRTAALTGRSRSERISASHEERRSHCQSICSTRAIRPTARRV